MASGLDKYEDYQLWVDYDELVCTARYFKKKNPNMSGHEMMMDIYDCLSTKYGITSEQVDDSLRRLDSYNKKTMKLLKKTLDVNPLQD